MHYYLEQRKWATGLCESRECTSGRKELKAMTPAQRLELLKQRAKNQPDGFTLRLVETDQELKEVPFTR